MLPKQLKKLLDIARNFSEEKIEELTADSRKQHAETTEKLEDLRDTLNFLQNKKNKEDHLKSI